MARNTRIHIARVIAPTWYICAAWLVLAIFLQVRFMHLLAIRNVEPSLVLVAVVWYAIRVEPWRAAAFGLAGGIAEDLLSYGTGGAWTISTTVVAIVAGMISRGFFADSLPLVATITFVATLVRQLVFWVVMGFEGYPSGLGMMHFHEALFEGLLNAATMMIVMLVMRRFDRNYA
ncbi:MAG TPA: rod shape-determining protein MreD [Candidatus Baltobacteraceae bacterium]|nr:rod shape-determining protein MreD [Candidatus Baltobacteraceae bacterium]